jgi:uncharacterized protein YgbK (DUF1537 family)
MEAVGSVTLPFVPAFPRLNRTTRKGHQFLFEQTIDKSSMALDQLNPITESFIPKIIEKQSDIPVRMVSISDELNQKNATRKEILLFDAERTTQLMQIARVLFKNNLLRTSAGCAGFAEALMKILPLEKTNAPGNTSSGRKKIIPENLPILVISGSLHPVSGKQAKNAARRKMPSIALNEENMQKTGWLKTNEAETLIHQISQTLLEKRITIIGTGTALGQYKTTASKKAADLISETTGKIVKRIIDRTGPVHLVVFGGDSLLGIMKVLKYNSLEPLREISPGVVLAQPEHKGKSLLQKQELSAKPI